MDNKTKLIEKLFNIRNEMDYFKKDATSGKDGNFTYKYVSGIPVLAEWRKLSEKYKVMLEPEYYNGKVERNIIQHKETQNYDFTVSTDINWKFIDVETGEERIVKGFGAGKQNDPSKAFGSEMTYCERYFLLKYFQIPTAELDPDAFDNKYYDEPVVKPETEKKKLYNDCIKLGIKLDTDNLKAMSETEQISTMKKLLSDKGVK